jgi:DNA-binding CsgD family transcriptional regulator
MSVYKTQSQVATRRRRRPAAPPPSPSLRETGFSLHPKVPWGAHLCVFYEDKADLIEASVAWLDAGMRSGEKCLWIVSDPLGVDEAAKAKARLLNRAGGSNSQIEIIDGSEWYLGSNADSGQIIRAWRNKSKSALVEGFSGLRAIGNTFWSRSHRWHAFYQYEQELNRSLSGHKIVVLCTYSLRKSSALDILDVAKAHQMSLALRKGKWEFVESPDLKLAKEEIKRLNNALAILSKPFPGHDVLTQREHSALAQIITGASSKEAARKLGVSPRTIEFHRANILRKLHAKNTADLLRKVLVPLDE